MESHITACPRNCYSTCSFRVWTENNRIVKIDPDPSNLAVPEGPCLKGLSYVERTHSPDRILYPLRKYGNSFERISWENALKEITDKLIYFKQKFGPHSILFYASSGMSGLLNSVSTNFWRMFGGATTVYGNLCWPAGLEAAKICLGENKHSVPWDLENARLILIWGKNPAECNIQQMIPIEKAQQKGAKLVVVDPRRTPSAERADILLQPRPGTDGILALAIARLIIDKNLHDKAFISTYVTGFPEFEKSLKKIDLHKASDECGVTLRMIREVAEMVATIKPMTLIAGYGMQRFSNGGQTTRCLLTLPVITGNIGKSGAGWQYANLQSYVFDKVKEPDSYYPSANNDRPFRRIIPTAKLGETMLQLRDPALKMAWVERGNPLAQNPDSKKVKEAFENIEYKVVIEQFMTDTAREADLILPAKSMFEQSDVIGSYWNPYVLLKQKVIDPPGEVKPETEIYDLLAHSLGYSEDEIRKNIPASDDDSIDIWMEGILSAYPELSMKKLKNGPILAPGLQEIAFSDMKFNTPSGKIELYSEKAEKEWGVDPLPEYTPLKISKKYPLKLMSPNTKNRIHSQFGNLNVIKILDTGPHVTISYKDAKDRKINEGDEVRIFNDLGELFLPARIDFSMRPGNVVIFNGYWNKGEGSPNMLTKGRETDMGHGTAFHDTGVQVRRRG
jgi:anaerobic selenocysteine-containing dehydrogenase